MYRVIIILTIIICGIQVNGQKIVHTADTVLSVAYDTIPESDSIYVVFGPAANGFSDTLNMTARFPGETKGTIKWYSIEANTNDTVLEQDLIVSAEDTSELTINTIEQGGYRVYLRNDSVDTTLTRWAYFDNLIVNPYYEESCNELYIEGIEGGVSFMYFNPDSVTANYTLQNGLHITWNDYYLDIDTDEWKELDSLEFDNENLNQYFAPPPINYKNYLFKVTVRDSLNHTDKDSVVYEALAVKADFVASQNGEALEDSLQFEAPLKMGFINKSLNSKVYEWTFFNDSARRERGKDSILRTSDFYEPLDSIKYRYPGKYDVQLKVEGQIFEQNGEEKQCVDSLRKRLYITIYKPFLGKLPNVLTPGGTEGKNDVFYFKDIEDWDYEESAPQNMPTTSIEHFEIYIYNRYGMRVYHYEGSEWNKEDAWDGRHNGSVVGSGVYYYVIKASGYGGRSFQKKGFFHVFSKN